MPEVSIEIGGRQFEVACQEGQEVHLINAASKLNDEALHIGDQLKRLTEAKMLLMSGLMLADRTLEVDKKTQDLEASLKEAQAEISRLNEELTQAREQGNVQELEQTYTKTLERIAERLDSIAT